MKCDPPYVTMATWSQPRDGGPSAKAGKYDVRRRGKKSKGPSWEAIPALGRQQAKATFTAGVLLVT